MVLAAGPLISGVMVAFLFYVQRFFDPIRSLMMQYNMMQRAMAVVSAHPRSARRAQVEVRGQAGCHRPRPRSTARVIEFKDVTFGYRARPAGTASNINMRHQSRARRSPSSDPRVRARQARPRLCTGSTTSGSGEVRVGGYDVRDVHPGRALGANVAMVLQEPFLFTGTILRQYPLPQTRTRRCEEVIEAAAQRGRRP